MADQFSVRHDKYPDRFLIACSMAPALVTAENIMSCDLEGGVHDAQGRKTYVERFIHSHSPTVIPFGETGARPRPICHMSGFLGATTPIFDIRHIGGESTDLLVRNQLLRRALANVLGPVP